MDVEFRVLGPLEVRAGDARIELGGPKQRTVLALLLANANRPVTAERIVDELWPEEPPNSATANVTTYLSRLRHALGETGASVERLGSGYSLTVAPELVDLHRFDRLTERGDLAWRTGDLTEAVDAWGRAYALWRGVAFEGLPAGPALLAARAELEERRLTVFERWVHARLRSGGGGDLIADLRRHTGAEPLREQGWLLLMAALQTTGNPAAALDAFEQARRVLADRLGADPGDRLRALHRAILVDDHSRITVILNGETAASSPEPEWAPPAQLPSDLPGFTGRAAELAELDRQLRRAVDERSSGVVITTIAGTAGVGKTTLAVHWAHRVAPQFPDGQLYVDLRGFDPSGSVLPPTEALRGFLDAIGVPTDRIPAAEHAQAALYRSRLAGRRMLVLLDNARDADHVRPLLPGAPGCLVVVTSRNELSGLVAAHGAAPIPVDLMSATEARHLLVRRLGPERIDAEAGATDEIIARCARLPLALAIVAARAAARPSFALADLARQLRAARDGLDAFATGGSTMDVRAVFSWSYDILSEPAAALFRLLGLYTTVDVGVDAAASLAGLPRSRVIVLLDELTRAHLLNEHAPGRYRFHDLLRVYAAELAQEVDAEPHRRAALRRLFDHYVGTTYAVNMLNRGGRRRLPAPTPIEGPVTVTRFTDWREGALWYRAEQPVLVTIVQQANDAGFDRQALELAQYLPDFFDRLGRPEDLLGVQRIALDIAHRRGDLSAQAYVLRNTARARTDLGQFDEARAALLEVLALQPALDDPLDAAHTHDYLASVEIVAGHYPEALAHAEKAAQTYRELGHQVWLGNVLNNTSLIHAQLGHYEQAVACCEQALLLVRGANVPELESALFDTFGSIQFGLGHYDEAIAWYRKAIDLCQEFGARPRVAHMLVRLGDAQFAAGNQQAAQEAWRRALDVFDDLGHRSAAEVRARLSGSAPEPLGPGSRN